MIASYHVHSKNSDGETSIQELIDGALRAGLDEIGISDHYTLLEGGKTIEWSMPLDSLPAYFEEIRAAAESVSGKLIVRYGIEMDFDPGAVKDVAEVLRSYPFDYVIGSVHFVNGFPIDYDKSDWDKLSEDEVNGIIREYLVRIEQMARTELFDITGHFDLYKKFGYLPTVDVSDLITRALDAIALSGMSVEINTAGWHKDVQEAYPSAAILAECCRRGIPVVISADAHNPDHLTRDFSKATHCLRETGYFHKAIYSKRHMSLVSL